MRIKVFTISAFFIALCTAFLQASCSYQPLPVTAQTANTNTPQKKEIRRPVIVSRSNWQAKAPKGEAATHTVEFITVHHTAVAQKKDVSLEKKMQGLQNFSQTESKLASGKLKPVWFDVPYHFYIAADGRIAEGRELKYVGDTNTAYDPTGHALVVVEGNFETEEPTKEQIKSLENLVAWLAAEHKVPAADIKAHNDYAQTACPGKNLKKLMPDLRKKVSGS